MSKCLIDFAGVDGEVVTPKCRGIAACSVLNKQLEKIGFDVSVRKACISRILGKTKDYVGSCNKRIDSIMSNSDRAGVTTNMERKMSIIWQGIRERCQEIEKDLAETEKGLNISLDEIIKDKAFLKKLNKAGAKKVEDIIEIIAAGYQTDTYRYHNHSDFNIDKYIRNITKATTISEGIRLTYLEHIINEILSNENIPKLIRELIILKTEVLRLNFAYE